ncbi:MAG: tol-pal system protein YbgF [Gammaproteobacteria bacterium]|nr:tol-pal system protein YbgF [Gammaproteobacteria bacterium]
MTFLRTIGCASVAVALWAAAASFATAQDGRLSLADRVARLEQQQAGGSGQQAGSVELLNRISQLQTEVQVLRGMLEEQDFKLRELERQSRDLGIDFDSRLERLESGSGQSGRFIDPEPSTAADSHVGGIVGSVVMEEPEVRGPVDAGVALQGVEGDPLQTEEQVVADPAAERAAYDAAFEALKNGQYAEAARRFQSFLGQFPNGEYAPNAQYWLGESYYVTQNYQIALDAFETLLARFPNSNKVPDALLKVGYSHYELRNWTQAEDTLNQVVQSYPDSTVARLAQGRLRALRLENRQ